MSSLQRVAALAIACLATACGITPPAGVFVCAQGERCPGGQYCHASDGLCHDAPEATGPIAKDDAGDDAADSGAECMPGDHDCSGTQSRSCSDAGTWNQAALVVGQCGTVCTPEMVRCQGATAQSCSSDGKAWADSASVCDCNKPMPASYGDACGGCGGKVQCDGGCSVATPSDFAKPCGMCGGTTQCDGRCSKATPTSFGQSCGCGGTLQCDGSCSKPAPANLDKTCGSCGGTFQCDGACSKATPSNYGASCGMCGGMVQCDGACSKPTPSNYGASCGSCGGTVQCDGACSIPDDKCQSTGCGGPSGATCSDRSQFCDYPVGSCGRDAQTGTCHGKPAACTDVFVPVCGCDMNTYSNSCTAAAAGVSMLHKDSCP